MQRPHEVTNLKIGIQIGRTIVSLAMKQNDSTGNGKVQNAALMNGKVFDNLSQDHSGENRIKKN